MSDLLEETVLESQLIEGHLWNFKAFNGIVKTISQSGRCSKDGMYPRYHLEKTFVGMLELKKLSEKAYKNLEEFRRFYRTG